MSPRASRLAAVVLATAATVLVPSAAGADVIPVDTTVHVGGRTVTLPNGETGYHIDLTQFDDEVDTVYGSTPTPWGTLEYVIGAYNESDPEGGSGGSQSSHCPDPSTHDYDHYKQGVIGGANPPTRSSNDHVYGSVYVHSCVEQDLVARVRENIGGSVARTSDNVVVRVPARAWISFNTPGLRCSDSNNDKGWLYTTYVATTADYGGRAIWQNESEGRRWAGC